MRFPHAPTWRALVEQETRQPYWQQLSAFVEDERQRLPDQVYPAEADVFAAFHQTARTELKAVILGQDPYHGPGQAHGLAFSVPTGVRIPPSLKNIFRELHDDIGTSIPSHGSLEAWARQGVLLLNTVLTVRKGEANSHRKQGWETFTDAVIHALGQQDDPLVFMLWGNAAIAKQPMIRCDRHCVISSVHPSPLSARRGFFGSRPFSRANDALQEFGKSPIDWRIDDGASPAVARTLFA